jgi:glycosyltransferase involved in cell wall biosynthesis
MRILMAHVPYRLQGGEDAVVSHEVEILRSGGHEVELLAPDSGSLDRMGLAARLAFVARFRDNPGGSALMEGAIARFRPDVIHFHNIYPMLGPGALRSAVNSGAGVVQTLHNYRLSCLAGTHLLGGEICLQCTVRDRSHGVVKRCYRGSLSQSALMNRALTMHWGILTDPTSSVIVVVLTDFMREWLLAAGMDPARVVVKPNSVPIASDTPGFMERHGAVFLGRLSEEKGVLELVREWPSAGPELVVVGDGPLYAAVRRAAARNVHTTGALTHEEAIAIVGQSRVVVLPSLCWEALPTVLLEACAARTPIISFDQGSIGSVVRSISPRLAVEHGDFQGLVRAAQAIATACGESWGDLADLMQRAHTRLYSDDANLRSLHGTYTVATSRVRADASCHAQASE